MEHEGWAIEIQDELKSGLLCQMVLDETISGQIFGLFTKAAASQIYILFMPKCNISMLQTTYLYVFQFLSKTLWSFTQNFNVF